MDDDEQPPLDMDALLRRPAWMEDAECRGLNPKMFFPERGELVSEEARAVCGECPVQRECLEYALATKERDGVWGGKSGRQRRDMRAAEIDRNIERNCLECGSVFMGNYRSKLCSEDCRKKRNAETRRRMLERNMSADQPEDRIG